MVRRVLVPLLALAAPPVGSPTVFPGLGVTIAGRAAGWNTSNTRDGGWGQPQSWLNLTFGLHDFVNSSTEGPWTLDTPHVSATVTRGTEQQREWELSLTPKVQLHYISFPLLPNGTHLDGRDELFYLLPFQGGAFAKDGGDNASYYANVSRSWESPGLVYPGRLHAPYFLLCTTDECLMAASTNWASRLAVRPRRAMVGTPQKEAALDFMNGCLQGYNIFSCTNKDAFPANRTTHLSIILGVFQSVGFGVVAFHVFPETLSGGVRTGARAASRRVAEGGGCVPRLDSAQPSAADSAEGHAAVGGPRSGVPRVHLRLQPDDAADAL